ncbi:Cytochrome P450, partial [Macrophomina phaseolina MS6]
MTSLLVNAFHMATKVPRNKLRSCQACMPVDATQFQALLSEIWAGEFDNLRILYLTTSPLLTGFYLSLVFAAIVFAISELNDNYSQVDRAWGLFPTIYNAHYSLWAHLSGLDAARVDLILGFTVLWAVRYCLPFTVPILVPLKTLQIRLSHTYGRKGGYAKGFEDYRWKMVRAKFTSKLLFTVFNLLFVSIWQNVVFYLATTPTYFLLVSSQRHPHITAIDVLFATVLLALLAIEGIADEQQWSYQTAKRNFLHTSSSSSSSSPDASATPSRFPRSALARGFPTHGLWAYSRHPNVAAEQGIWIALYAWSFWHVPFNAGFFGLAAYLLPFYDSSKMTEAVSAGKYAEYAEYQRQVGRWVPRRWWWSG